MSSPSVSIIMNCFNGEKYLPQALDSILAQTFEDWELIFWDNQSNDRSAEIFKNINDPRLKYFYAPNHTLLYEARNYAIEKSSGEFIAFLDVDDWWEKDKLKKQVSLFSDPDVGVVCGNYWVINETNNKKRKALIRSVFARYDINDLLKKYYVGLLTLIIRRSTLNDLDYICNPEYHIIGDFDLVIRLLTKCKLDYIQEPVAYYRLHGNNETSKYRSKQIEEIRCWTKEMNAISAVSSQKNFYYVSAYLAYLEGMQLICDKKKSHAYKYLSEIPWGVLKLKYFVALMMPERFVTFFKF